MTAAFVLVYLVVGIVVIDYFHIMKGLNFADGIDFVIKWLFWPILVIISFWIKP